MFILELLARELMERETLSKEEIEELLDLSNERRASSYAEASEDRESVGPSA